MFYTTFLPFYIFITLILITICLYLNYDRRYGIWESINDTAKNIAISFGILIICAILERLVVLSSGLFYAIKNGESIYEFFENAMVINLPSIIVVSCTSIILVFALCNNALKISTVFPVTCAEFFGIVISYLLFSLINFNEPLINASNFISSMDGLDYGSGMACSYFFGYLKIILPDSGGTERLGIAAALDRYESSENVPVAVKKLFILIPVSSYIPTNLVEMSDTWMEFSKTTEIVVLNRAGVINRKYSNTVYKINEGGKYALEKKPIYLAVEGATPLLTLYETQKNVHKYAAKYNQYAKDIVKSFYQTLQYLLNEHLDCKHYCELVYYEDYEPDGVTRVNPAKVLLERIDNLLINKTLYIKD